MPIGFEPGAVLPKLLLFIIYHQELFVPLSGNLNFNHFHKRALQSCGYYTAYQAFLLICGFAPIFPRFTMFLSLLLSKRPRCRAADAPHTMYTSICNISFFTFSGVRKLTAAAERVQNTYVFAEILCRQKITASKLQWDSASLEK